MQFRIVVKKRFLHLISSLKYAILDSKYLADPIIVYQKL